jgi:hypothetical protein
VSCSFRVDDLPTLKAASLGRYGTVIAMDNALPHLDSDDDIIATFAAMRLRLSPRAKCSSVFVTTIGISENGMRALDGHAFIPFQ